MFYSIGNIFTREPRQAEHTDTRQAIQRHDPDFQRSKDDQHEDTGEEFGENFAFVSVSALILFLQNFVKEHSREEQFKDAAQALSELNDEKDVHPEEPHQRAPANPQAAKAANAYQTMAQANKQNEILIETTDAAQGPSLDLSNQDLRSIYALIEDLNALSEQNVETLKIERAETFMDSLKAAVQRAKATL